MYTHPSLLLLVHRWPHFSQPVTLLCSTLHLHYIPDKEHISLICEQESSCTHTGFTHQTCTVVIYRIGLYLFFLQSNCVRKVCNRSHSSWSITNLYAWYRRTKANKPTRLVYVLEGRGFGTLTSCQMITCNLKIICVHGNAVNIWTAARGANQWFLLICSL